MFSGGMKRDQWHEMGYLISAKCYFYNETFAVHWDEMG